MAGNEKLTVSIGADITDFEKKIKEVELDIKELSKVKLDQIKIGLDTKVIDAQIKDAKNNLNGLKTALKDTGNSFAAVTPKVANAGSTLTQFSRIAQDAPYGIIGIGNNITATAESFSYLKAQTGSTGGALKALASSLMGSGGILLGVSLLTTGLTLLAQSGLSVGDVIDKLTGDFDEFGKSVTDAYNKGAEAAGSEIVTLKALVGIAQDETRSRGQRLEAANKLQDIYPKILGSLSDETILTKDLSKEVNILSNALIARATASKLAEVAGTNQVSIFKDNAALVKQKAITDKLRANQAKEIADANKRGAIKEAIEAIEYRTNRLINDSLEAEQEVRTAIVAKTRTQENYNTVLEKTLALSQSAEKPIAGGKGKAGKAAEVFNTPQVAPLESSLLTTGLVAKPIDFTPLLDSVKNVIPQVMLSFSEMEIAWQNTVDNIGSIMEQALEAGIFNIGDAIGTALVNGDNVLQAAGGALLQTLGGFISDIAKEMIEFGVLTSAFGAAKEALSKAGVSGVVAIVAGVALAGIGAAISASGKKVSSAASGKGSTSTATGAGANNSYSSSSSTSGGYGGGGTVVFEISGQKLIGVLNNTLDANKRLGGNIRS